MQITSGRPTQRCLGDLHTDWDSATHHGLAQRGIEAIPFELPDLQHPIVRKAAEQFPETAGDADVLRESISGLSDPVWWKVKIGSRWRGAAWEDPETGQAWLCAAGYRREGEASDFYKQFMGEVAANGSAKFLPTEGDRERLLEELKSRALAEWELSLCARVRSEILQLVDLGGGELELEIALPEPREEVVVARATLTVELEDVDGESLLDVVVALKTLDYSQVAVAQWAEMVVLTAIEPREQVWGSLPVDGVPTRSFTCNGQDVDLLIEALRAGGPPGEVRMGDVAHYAHRSRLTESVVEGDAVKSVCGAWFVVKQDHEALETCPYCEAVMRVLPAGAD